MIRTKRQINELTAVVKKLSNDNENLYIMINKLDDKIYKLGSKLDNYINDNIKKRAKYKAIHDRMENKNCCMNCAYCPFEDWCSVLNVNIDNYGICKHYERRE